MHMYGIQENGTDEAIENRLVAKVGEGEDGMN